MPDELQYKDFVGSVHFSVEDAVFHGKVEGVGDVVSYEGKTVPELKAAFEVAVEDYLQLKSGSGYAGN